MRRYNRGDRECGLASVSVQLGDVGKDPDLEICDFVIRIIAILELPPRRCFCRVRRTELQHLWESNVL